MFRQKVDVSDLAIGMYVTELDRPWVGAPFLFQGFMIQEEDELRRLREHCNFVYVDIQRSEVAIPQREHIPPARRQKAQPRVVRRGPEPDLTGQADPALYPTQLKKASLLRQSAGRVVARAFDDVRLGASVDTDEARRVVSDLVGTISDNANASLWLTNLKNKDEYTSIHCMNVCILTIAFGRHLGFPREELEVMGLGALLHDVGKVRTPSEILNKPGKLTREEFAVMKRHPAEGYEIMKATGRMPAMALDIIRFHHERLRGNGYPDGLGGDEIATPILITAIADVYDAITSERCYHHGIPAHEGLKLLYQLAPHSFGQELVEEFIRCIGIYPVGSLVELTTGALGVVLSADPKCRLKPLLLLVRDPHGQPYTDRRLVNLAGLVDSNESWRKWSIRRVLDPREYGVDVKAVAAAELESNPEIRSVVQ